MSFDAGLQFTDITLHPGDNRVSLRRLIDEGVRVHSVVTDPPYGLSSIVKRYGKDGAAPAKHGTDGAFQRLSGGFMGKAWDGTGIERDPEFWRLIWEILLPGGYVFAFSGSRTGHWQACAMETAGFIMHPMHGWVFGSGFPKAHDASKAIDKLLGAKRELTRAGTKKRDGYGDDWDTGSSTTRPRYDAPVTPEAAQWDGWAYGTQSTKPAMEPIYLGQRPFSEKTGAANLLKHGVGAVNTAACRVPGDEVIAAHHGTGGGKGHTTGSFNENYKSGDAGQFLNTLGRWPANLLHDGSPEVVALFPDTGKTPATYTRSVRAEGEWLHAKEAGTEQLGYGDSGSAARFFNCFPPDMPPTFYCPKAGKADRAGSKHPTVKPVALMRHLIRHITPPGGTILDPFAGSGTTGEAARREGFDCILMEAEPEYVEFLQRRFAITRVVSA